MKPCASGVQFSPVPLFGSVDLIGKAPRPEPGGEEVPHVGSSPAASAMEAHEIGDSSGLEIRGSARAWGFDSLRFRESIPT